VFNSYFDNVNLRQIVQWFELGGSMKLDDTMGAREIVQQLSQVQDLLALTGKLGLSENESDAMRASAGELILEGLYAHKRISRNEELEFVAGERPSAREERRNDDRDDFGRKGFDNRRGGRKNLN
jgi:magnesium chelatase subunit I